MTRNTTKLEAAFIKYFTFYKYSQKYSDKYSQICYHVVMLYLLLHFKCQFSYICGIIPRKFAFLVSFTIVFKKT